MEPKFQSSFIPKSPITTEGGGIAVVHSSGNIFSMLATFLFIVTLLASGGLYVYKGILNGQIADNDKSLNSARDAFQPEKMQELLDANSRIQAAKTLLDNHVAISPLLLFLQSATVRNMRFDTLAYKRAGDGQPSLSLSIEAVSYNALAQEQDIFSKSELIKNPSFSDFSLSENGTILAKFFSNVNQSLLMYKKVVTVN